MWPILTTFLGKLSSCFLESGWGFFARHAGYMQKLEDNLADVKTTLDNLTASKEQVMQRVLVEELQQQKKRLAPVVLWFERVDKAVAEGQKLIKSGDQELQRLCLGGYCSMNCWSTSIFGKEVDKFLNEVRDLEKKHKEFDQVTAETPAAYVQKLEDNLADVKTTLDNLTASKKQVMRRVLVEEQQQQKKRLEQVVLWFERVDKAVAEGQQLIKSGDQELQRLCLGGYCSIDCWSTSIFGKKVDKFLNEVRDLQEKHKEFDQVTAETPAELVAELPCDTTVGLESKFDEVWSCLAHKDVVGVYGIGGVGKTTLLTQIHNKFVDTSNNILVIWVVVGKDARHEKIQENIGNKIALSNDLQRGSKEAIEKIFNKLRREKFVLFLDDIWKRVELAKIGIPTQEKLKGSKIIFSTRSSKVCYEMRAQRRIRVETLEWENAWELFRKHAGEDTINVDPEIPPLAKIMANKCGGLPIALKVVGRAMSGKLEPREWRHSIRILKEPSQHLQGVEVVDELLNDMEVEVFEILKFSYDSLPNDKWRSCFLYCALYPDDNFIDKDTLVDFWMCEDFWDNGLTMEARDEAYSIIDALVRSCLLEDEGQFVKMHDVIRDMALWLEKDNFLVKAGMQLKEVPGVEKWEGVRRLSLMYNNIEELTQVPPCQKLVTLFLNDNEKLHEVNEDFFHSMGALTVLDLSYTNLRMLPKSIEKLVSLQYLNIESTRIKELPVELATLSKLKSFDVSGLNLKAKKSEGVISGMSSLQVLKMANCSYRYHEEESAGEDDKSISKLSTNDEKLLLDELDLLEHLKELYLTVSSVHSLERLNIMRRKLLTTITYLYLKDLEGSRSLNIRLLETMRYLSFIKIANCCDLEEMHYLETRQAAAVGSISSSSLHMETLNFSCLRLVRVINCNFLKDLTIMLVLLPNLTYLSVESCYKMEEIISSAVKLGEAVDLKNLKLFSKLGHLFLEDLPELRCIHQNPLPFPLLRHVGVLGCPLLTKLPLDSNSRDGPKIELQAYEEWWEAIQWEDDATKAALLPRFKCFFY